MNWMVIKRVLVGGAKNFIRGGAVSAATVLIMTVTLSIIGSLIFLSALLTYTLDAIRDKVDVTVYFVTTASEQEIFAVKSQLEKLPQVTRTTYTSREDVLTAFRERNAGNQLNLQALDLVGGNPFDASLEVHAKDPSQYENIVSFLESSPALTAGGVSIIDSINYVQNKKAIGRLSLMIDAMRGIGFPIVLLFAIASILIAFATIRLAIYTAKDEIGVMRLMGASNAYIRGPFVITGVITGAASALVVLFLLWPATWYAGARTTDWFGGFNLFAYYGSHFFFIFWVLMLSGIMLGAAASVLAVRRYLTV